MFRNYPDIMHDRLRVGEHLVVEALKQPGLGFAINGKGHPKRIVDISCADRVDRRCDIRLEKVPGNNFQ